MKRPTGIKWRQRTFAALVERDGGYCADCGTVDRTIWRQMGTWSGEQWGESPWENWRYTQVHPTSNLEVEHLVALSDGGDNSLGNLRLLCVACHKRKTSAERSSRLKRLFAEARAA
jgi:5-methylcytosine-specific restriction endonuclease McrA